MAKRDVGPVPEHAHHDLIGRTGRDHAGGGGRRPYTAEL